jgi:hypothetical protein
MRIMKRREPSARPAVKPENLIVFQDATKNWRERVKALKAAQAAEQCKPDTEVFKPERARF